MRLLPVCNITKGVFCWMLHLLLDVYAEEATTKQTGWIPSTIFANSSLTKYLIHNVSATTAKIKSQVGRAFHDNRIDSIGFDYHEYDHGEIPFISADSSGSSYFPAHYQPGSASSYISSSSGSSSLYPYPPSGYPYPGASYLPPSPSYLQPPSSSSQYQSSQSFDVSNSFLYGHDQSQNTSNIPGLSAKKHLYVQPGQCSNSIQVQRIRNIEVQTSLTYGTAVKQGVCVLMLYGANEYNKLAISMQFANSSTSVIPSNTWLETNLKVYYVQTGAVTFLNTTYGSELVLIESYSENNYTANFVTRNLGPAERRSQRYWLGLTSLDDLRTNTLESAGGILVSQYSGFWSLSQPDPTSGECVDVNLHDEIQSWQLQTCETLLPFLCRASACPAGSFHCSNGKCINAEFKCDKYNDCGDWSDELDCPSLCHYYMASSGDVVESPNFPHKYESMSNCKWTLEGPQGHNIFLQFQEFETEKSFDTVQILVGGRTEDKAVSLATLSGKLDLSNTRYVSASNFMIVKFSTDASVEKKGFRASWKTEPITCGGNLRATPQPQTLTSPGYPQNYPGGLECLYTISAQPGRIITLELEDINLVYERDYILVRDGDHPKSPLLANLTGDKKNNARIIMSTVSDVYLYFRTSLGETKKGFKIKYSQGCRATIVDVNGTLSSPAFDLTTYPSNLDCLIRIKNPTSGPLSLKFDSMNIHPSDFVEIYDGGSTSGLRLHPNKGFTGNAVPKITVTASSGEMLVRFLTDALHGGKGWHATFSADCPVLRPGEGALASNRDTSFGTVVTFSCAPGQEFATGRSKIVTECLMGGNWSVTYIPRCQEVYCGPVPQIDNGFSIGATNVTYKGVAYYQCYAGFGFSSGQRSEKITCLADGRWEKLPSCQASQCPPLAETPHANATILNGGGRSYGTIVRFECEPGYVRNGHPVVLCMSNGTWSSPVPTCTRAECSELPTIDNGFIIDPSRQYFYGDEARVQCHRGFKLTGGSSIIKCGAVQKFLNVPKCEDVNECATSQCDSASTDCINTSGGFYCRCRTGFAPNLDCRPIGDLGLISGGIPDEAITVSSSEAGFMKETVRLSSMRGWCGSNTEPGSNWAMFDLKAPTTIRGFRTQGVVRGPNKFAFTTAIRIQYTNNLTDVLKDYTNPDGTPVEFRILEPTLSVLNLPLPIEAQFIKFKIQDYVGAPCLRLEIMGCSRLECMDINECGVNNGGCDQKCINSPGNFSCACNVGYELYTKNGTAGFPIDESETGERDGDIYQRNKTCVPVMCPKLVAPENGKLFSTKDLFHFGDLVHFTCNFGFVMSGSASLLCSSTGAWNGTVPQCHYAKCVSLPDDKAEGLSVLRANTDTVLVPFKENVTLRCNSVGRKLKGTATSGFRQCVYDPKPGLPDYWLSGSQPACQRVDCGPPIPTPGAEYGNVRDTKFHSSFFFGCQDTFRLAGQTERNDNVVRCESNGIWDFGDLRCEGPVCEDPGRPVDGYQTADSYEQGSEVQFGCGKPGYILINPRPITCIREPECKVIKPLGISSGRIPDSAINATSERPNYEAHNIRLNSVTGWCGRKEAFTYVSVDLGHVYRIKAILVKGVITNDIVGRPTEIRFFYKQAENENFVVYFPNFNLTIRDPGNYGELAMITLPKYVQARFVILGIVSYMDNACLKFELMGCEEPKSDPLLGYDYGYSPCVDNEAPVFQDCPQQPVIVRRGSNGIEPINMTEPTAVDNSGGIARLDIKPQSFKLPHTTFHDMVVKYTAFDYDGNVAICEFNITVADETPPQLSCPQSYVIELVDKQDSYEVNFNETRKRVNVSDASGDVFITYSPEKSVIAIGDFENVTVTATDKFGNKATCYFQVSVQATSCVDWELTPPANGALNCLPGDNTQLQCIATCNKGFRFTDGEAVKTFNCEQKSLWSPSSVVPDCVSEDTQQADYHFIPSITYRANGAVSPTCLRQYTDLVSQYYSQLDMILTQRCSAVNVNMNVTFLESKPSLLDDNVVQIDYVLGVLPAIRQPQLYDLCGSTLNLIFDLSVPYASAAIDPLLNVSAVGNQCPPLKALRSTTARGFSCNVGEVLNMDANQVPRCLHCPAGTSAGVNQKSCTLCPRGFYQDRDRQGSCSRCPQGTYTREEGSKSLSQCIPVCGYGTYSPTGLVPCLECPRNSYTTEPPLGGFKECHTCPANTFTYQPAAPSREFCRTKCPPGHYSETGLAPCAPCPASFYQPVSGQTVCLECPSSTRTKGTGSAGREECQNVVCTENSCQHGGLCVPMGHTPQCFCPAGFSGKRCEIDIDECASQPCYNGGVCVDLPQGYKCQCKNGYSGINCQEEKSDCKNDTCPQRAMCKDEPGVGNFTCLCRSGYTGDNCDVTVDPCSVNGNPCKNDAKCLALKQGRYKCECTAGWEGMHCEENIDDCSERPCLLGAPCTDLVNDFKCTCPSGFTGKRCETKIDLCADNPCENGICVDKLFSRQCVCHPGWTGPNCEVNIDECARQPCMHDGECTDLVNDYKCTCDVFYTGKRCQHMIDDCASQPCQNGGSCVDMEGGFTCNCRPGFVGLQCEAEIDECLSEPCNPEGTDRCLDLENKFKCVCHPGFTGEFCDNNIDDCESKPCMNGGKCIDGINKYTCKCPPGWTGPRCEIDVSSCQSKPCLNDARCINLFQDFFCVCPSGTDGKQCETAPERCIGNPCMHGGKCQDFGSGLNCSCSTDFTGVGCQYEFDACQANVCQNGATCVDNGVGYNCLCPPGFTGKNCDEDVINCRENSCPPTATCIDLTDKFYCQCPFNLTGDDCRKTIQVDYDLSFPEASYSSAALSVPFRFDGSRQSFTVAMWVQFSHRDEPGVFFTLYSVTSNHLVNNRRILIQAQSSGIQVSLFSEIPEVFLGFQEYATINDGQWHHVAIVWQQGVLTSITDGLIASKVEGYGAGKKLPEFGWVMLGKPLPDPVKSYTALGFQGHLSKVQIWGRALDVTNEIQKQVRDCRTEPVLYQGLILTWAGYEEIQGGVERIVPSHCSHHVCPAGYAGLQCDQMVQDKIPPKIEYCPGDLWVITKNGSANVHWDEPKFNDNVGVVRIEEKSGHHPGQTLMWGNYQVVYVAFDAVGNAATCAFRVYVLAEFCPPLADPIGGSQVCKDWGYGGQFKVCEIGCNTGLRFSEPVPKFYTCGAEGFWRPTSNPNLPVVYPACSQSKSAQRVFKVGMKFPTSVLCNEAGQGVLRQKVRNSINALNRDWNFCSNSLKGTRECKDLNIEVKCEHRVTRSALDSVASYDIDASLPVRREKRETGDTYGIQISFPATNDPVLNLNSNQRASVQQLLEKLILEEDQFNVHDILPNTDPDPASLKLESDYACPPGEVVMPPDCVPCAVGMYFNKDSHQCLPCPAGTYQSETGQMQCTACPTIAGRPGVTIDVGARSASQCKERCPAGKYYDDEAGLCRSCGHGFYQPSEGSFKCLLCGLGKTTRSTEAVTSDECRDECDSGMQLASEGECELCPRGTYRTRGVEPACQSCPVGRTTPKGGAATIEECSLPICLPGTFLNGSLNSCVPCKKGTYQPNAQQSSCIPCPINTSTKGIASASKSDCWNPCESGTSEIHCDKNAHCLLIPETNDFKCECKPGFNGTGKHCVDLCEGFCENKGLCIKDIRGNPTCRCVGSFIGTRCENKSDFAYIAGGISVFVILLIVIALFVWMICARSEPRKEPKKLIAQTNDQTGSQVNFYYGAAPYAESIAPSHHSTYAHYYDDEEDGWEMPNY